MYTRPAARSRGVVKALLRKIEDEARREDKSVFRLENADLPAGSDRPIRAHGISATGSVRPVRGNACV